MLALLLHEQKRNEDAALHAEAALSGDPKQMDAMLAQACILRDAREYGAAQAFLNRLLAQHPMCGRAWLERALIKLHHLHFDAAAEDVGRATVHLPEHVGPWHVMAWIKLGRGNLALAEAAFQKAYALDRNFAETHGGLAIIAAMQGREEDARACMQRALRLDRESISVHYAEMVLLQRAGKDAQALAVLDGFMARPVEGGEQRFHDIIVAHIRYLEVHSSDPRPAAVALH